MVKSPYQFIGGTFTMNQEALNGFHANLEIGLIIQYISGKQQAFRSKPVYSEHLIIRMLVDYSRTLEKLLEENGVGEKIVARQFDLAVQRMWRDMNIAMYEADEKLVNDFSPFADQSKLESAREILANLSRASLNLALAELESVNTGHSIKKVLRDNDSRTPEEIYRRTL
jgi:hypothetical protein